MTAPDRAELVTWGRCRSGKRWFWAARWYESATWQEHIEHGRTDTEAEALREGEAAARQITGGGPVHLTLQHGVAADVLKAVSAAQRQQRPPAEGQAAEAVEYLYGIDHGGEHNDFTSTVVQFRIIRRTARRIYYLNNHCTEREQGTRYVDRQELEAAGKVRRASRYAGEDFTTLYAAPPDLDERRRTEPPVDLGALRQRMADAHPDRGGTDAEFIAARTAYDRARQLT
ncbi:hypothetical protein [Streptomyces sp. NBC_01439]|uniref:hypothetical protein n=1 Tax=Streptomyces sp. NBC_01439 TaxID=2903867 RepID=UPI002E2C2B1A|nr:hypothetical protein [Streptomyces sp. NBC_01439]